MSAKTHIAGEDYWKWRCSILDMQKRELELKLVTLEHKLLSKDAEMIVVRAQLFQRTRVESAKEMLDQSKTEYDAIKKKLEEQLGYSLNGKMIDDFTYEVCDLPQTQTIKES